MRLVSCLIASLALTGCGVFTDPTYMPAGYTYHNDFYKSPPGPAAEPIGYPFSPERNDVVVEKWQAVATSLIDSMESKNIQPQPVYVVMLANQNTFNATLDYVLREELRKRGYQLANVPEGVLQLRPEAFRPEDKSNFLVTRTYNGDEKNTRVYKIDDPERAQDFIIGFDIVRAGMVKGRIENTFRLPAYGYVPGEGRQSPVWFRDKDKRQAPQAAHPAPAQQFREPADETDPGPVPLAPVPVDEDIIQEPI